MLAVSPVRNAFISKKLLISEFIAQDQLLNKKYTFTISDSDQKFSFDNYYLSTATYEWAFQSAGFKEVSWHKPIVSPQGVEEFGQEFWQDFLNCVPIIGIECLK